MSAAGMIVNQFLGFTVQPSGVSNAGGAIYHFVTATLDKERRQSCRVDCAYKAEVASGDSFPYPIIEQDVDPPVPHRRRWKWWRELKRAVFRS